MHVDDGGIELYVQARVVLQSLYDLVVLIVYYNYSYNIRLRALWMHGR